MIICEKCEQELEIEYGKKSISNGYRDKHNIYIVPCMNCDSDEYEKGKSNGFNDGKEEGLEEGKELGKEIWEEDGFVKGYDKGFIEGFVEGAKENEME